MGKISEIFNFDNIGGKIKNLAKWSCWITILIIWIAAPISFIVLVSDDWTAYLWWIPLVGAIIAPVFVWIGSWAMYAFGELVEDVHAIRNKEGIPAEEAGHETKEEIKHNIVENETLKKATQCECGELHYARYCPICGKKAGASTSNTEKPLKVEDKPQPKSTICKCGKRFYGDICPNCGRNVKDL